MFHLMEPHRIFSKFMPTTSGLNYSLGHLYTRHCWLLASCCYFPYRMLTRTSGMVSGMTEPSLYPEYVLAFHSSKRLLIEQLNSSHHLLADAIINLTLAKGEEVHSPIGDRSYKQILEISTSNLSCRPQKIPYNNQSVCICNELNGNNKWRNLTRLPTAVSFLYLPLCLSLV